jgi:hypothetical protein
MPVTIGTNAYITLSDYQNYAADRNISVNTATLESDVIQSADFIDTYYTFKGAALDEAQAMKLPTDAVAIADIKKAALKAVEMQQVGLLTIDLAAFNSGIVSSEAKSLDGVGSKSVTYEQGTRSTFKARTPQLDMLLRPYLAYAGGLVRG